MIRALPWLVLVACEQATPLPPPTPPVPVPVPVTLPPPAPLCAEPMLRAAATRLGDAAPVFRIETETGVPTAERSVERDCPASLDDAACIAQRRGEIVLAADEHIDSAGIVGSAYSWAYTYMLDGVDKREVATDTASASKRMTELRARGHVVVPTSGERVISANATRSVRVRILRGVTQLRRRHMTVVVQTDKSVEVAGRLQALFDQVPDLEVVTYSTDTQRRVTLELTCPKSDVRPPN